MDIISKYDKAALGWDKKVLRMRYSNAYQCFLQDHLETRRPVLDIGTGTGLFAAAWLAAGGSRDLTLIEPSKPMLHVARARFAGASVPVKDIATTLENYQPTHPFQTVLAAHVIEHCDDPLNAMEKLSQCLCTGGKLILVVSKPHWCNWFIWLRYRHRWYAPDALYEWAQAAGLDHETTHRFTSGPPSRTSIGYVFTKPKKENLC
ncbi:MAG: class I SAM-dependent methyltransferase [Paracoccaceae bacterium]